VLLPREREPITAAKFIVELEIVTDVELEELLIVELPKTSVPIPVVVLTVELLRTENVELETLLIEEFPKEIPDVLRITPLVVAFIVPNVTEDVLTVQLTVEFPIVTLARPIIELTVELEIVIVVELETLFIVEFPKVSEPIPPLVLTVELEHIKDIELITVLTVEFPLSVIVELLIIVFDVELICNINPTTLRSELTDELPAYTSVLVI